MRTATQAGTTRLGGGETTMPAIVQDRYGSSAADVLRLEMVDVPTIRKDEVLVRVRAAGVDRGVWHLMAGLPYLARAIGFGLRRPKTRTPGTDFAGVVEAVGTDVTDFVRGDEVFGTGKATYAGYAAARASRLVSKPATLTFEQAAAVPVSATTALQAVRRAGVRAGERVLVIGASGGVGSYAVQIAKAEGAEVTGVARTAKLDFVRAMGADRVVDYTRDDPTGGEQRYDAIIDIGGNRPVAHLRRALAPKGRLVITGGEDGGRWLGGIDRNLRAQLLSPFVGQKLGAFVARTRRDDLVVVSELIQAGSVTPPVDRTYPLVEAAAAITHVADGHAQGKVVITL
jgi:NADPH:quinone reductase-like Zn-dependent oxidoreductase